MIAAPPKVVEAPPVLAQWEEYFACKVNPGYFIDTYVQIKHPGLGTIPFRLWDWQYQLLEVFQEERKTVVLKARQIGVTELSAAYALWKLRFFPSQTISAISKSENDAEMLIDKTIFGYDHLPRWLQASDDSLDGTRLGKRNLSTLEIIHVDDQGQGNPSIMKSLSASENTSFGMSLSLVILDEWSRQQNGEQIWSGAEGATSVGGQVIGISTAKGLGNFFHRTWEKAMKGENDFKPFFLGWKRRPERDEAWYANQKKNLSPWQLHENYPATPSEAFIQTGRPVFEPEVIDAHAARLADEHVLGWEDEPGLTIYEWPTYDWRTGEAIEYLIAADVAEGLEDGDYDAAVVLNRSTGAEVAELRGQWSPSAYAAKLDKLGVLYNYALLAIERNNHGHAVLLALTSGVAHQAWAGEQEEYPVIYYYEDPSDRNGKESSKPGWPTTSVTKPLMIDKLGEALRDMAYHTRSRIFLSEGKIFAHLDGGGMGAPQGYHDDTVICRAIAWFLFVTLARTIRMWIPNVGERRREEY
jgi:hypothetical protein